MKILKMKKTAGDIIILLKCTKDHDNLLYCFGDMAHGCNYYLIIILGYQTFFQALFYNR